MYKIGEHAYKITMFCVVDFKIQVFGDYISVFNKVNLFDRKKSKTLSFSNVENNFPNNITEKLFSNFKNIAKYAASSQRRDEGSNDAEHGQITVRTLCGLYENYEKNTTIFQINRKYRFSCVPSLLVLRSVLLDLLLASRPKFLHKNLPRLT